MSGKDRLVLATILTIFFVLTKSQAQKNIVTMLITVPKALSSNCRRNFAQVEEGPGVFKSWIETYPKGFFQSRLKYLLALKKRKDDMMKKNKPKATAKTTAKPK